MLLRVLIVVVMFVLIFNENVEANRKLDRLKDKINDRIEDGLFKLHKLGCKIRKHKGCVGHPNHPGSVSSTSSSPQLITTPTTVKIPPVVTIKDDYKIHEDDIHLPYTPDIDIRIGE
nr:uncharacterized protein LOC111418099 [Onthophagus taurus]